MLQRKSILWHFRKTFGIWTRISMHFLQSNILSFYKYLLGHELWRLFKRIRTYILFIKLMKHWFCVTFSLNWSSGECYKRTCTTARILILLLHIFPFSEGIAHCLNNVHLSKFTQGYVPSICHLVKGGGGGSKPPRSKGAGWTLLNQTGGVIYRQKLGKIYSKDP